MEGQKQNFKADPRENLSLNKKLNILEKAKIKKDLIEKKRRLEKSWETVRWVMKMLQHDLLTWTDIPDDSDSWKNAGSNKFNSKKQKFIKKYKKKLN